MPDSVSQPSATDRGRTLIEDVVVAKIAGMAAREVSGVHSLGSAPTRMVGALRDNIPGARTSAQQGVSVEVGPTQATVDIAIVAEYGVAIHELAAAIRRNVIVALERMTGLDVPEVNITVHDVHLAELDDSYEEVAAAPRVK